MRSPLKIGLVLGLLAGMQACTAPFKSQPMNFYELQATDLQGKLVRFDQFKGRKVLLVNTASECGFTPQLSQLQTLQERYPQDLVVVGIPTNDFAGQEPLNNTEIGAFCSRNYGVTFLILSKGSTKGPEQHQVFEWLTTRKLNGRSSSRIWWNFQKYLVDEEGRLVDWYLPTTSPLSSRICNRIRKP